MTNTVTANDAEHIDHQGEHPTQQRDAFMERMLQSTAGLFDIFTIYIGDRLGFYQALAAQGWMTSSELANTTGTHERYVREWLEQQTVASILEVEDENEGSPLASLSSP